MNYLNFVKNNFTKLPYPIGKVVSYIPYEYRPGLRNIYTARKAEMSEVETYDNEAYKKFVFLRTKKIATYAYQHIPFYRELYKTNNVSPDLFADFSDLKDLPIINKSDLQEVPLEFRSNLSVKGSLANTGGSSGAPLSFYIQPDSIPHEWAHMHTIWHKLGYKQSDLKIVFGGRANVKNIIEYDAVRHQLTVDIYQSAEKIADKLYTMMRFFKPKYLHGYPSAIFDFVIWLDINCHPLLNVFRNTIKGMFLGSEYPSPQLRTRVESLLKAKSVSWYGHTERAILAYEKNSEFNYSPFITYGFAEALETSNSNDFELVGTSYYNYASPLIRYNTNDKIAPTIRDGLLESFQITKGRNGEFILDIDGNKIYLTALIFGRHHNIFNYAQHIQVKQVKKGEATIYISSEKELSNDFIIANMDLTNVNIKFNLIVISSPIKTKASKVPLLIK